MSTETASPADLIPENEEARLAAVRRYDILDTPPDGTFDRITSLAARLFDVPICIVSIVDTDRIWFKSHHGLEVDEIPRDPGLCASAILHEDPWVVTDAQKDPRTLTNPLVASDFGLQFYAAAPLKTADGYNLGTINIIDLKPRTATEKEIALLQDLAGIVMDELELRLAARRVERQLEDRRSDFTVAVSHELRTPVASIYGAIETLRHGNVDESRWQELLTIAGEQAERLKVLVDDLLAAGELDRTSFRIVSDRVDTVAVARSAVSAAASYLPLTLTLDFEPPEGSPVVEADPGRIRQVLGNLLDNAIRYSPDGGRIVVAVTAADEHVRFLVRDEGLGVPDSARESIFEKFQRQAPSAVQGATGSGLGLYIARELAWRMDGRLWVEPNDGRGSTFVLELPAAPRA